MPGPLHFFARDGREVTEEFVYEHGGFQRDEDECVRLGLLTPVDAPAEKAYSAPPEDKAIHAAPARKAAPTHRRRR